MNQEQAKEYCFIDYSPHNDANNMNDHMKYNTQKMMKEH